MAEAMGLFSPRDGYGHSNSLGVHEKTGRPKGEHDAREKRRVRGLRQELESMPDDAGQDAVARVFEKHGGLA